MNVIAAPNAPVAYCEALWKMRVWAEEEESRNGPVMSVPDPVLLRIYYPTERVLFDPVRNANPFFHLMEAIWMLAGENDVQWLEYFNTRYREYADPDTDVVHGAYGHRWRRHFGIDQIVRLRDHLRTYPESRRAVLGMWDPRVDMDYHNDIPCNTQIMFRIVGCELQMTVINRSNDLVWGMLGANVVHMTMLQELMAYSLGMGMGDYTVFTNNLHVYKNLENFDKIWNTVSRHDPYSSGAVSPYPLLRASETIEEFLLDCQRFVLGQNNAIRCQWFYSVALPMRAAYTERKEKRGDGLQWVERIAADDWRLACQEWVARKESSSSTSTEPSPATGTGTI